MRVFDRMKWLAVLALLATPALAQTGQTDAAFLQRAIVALQQQRNAALDLQAQFQALLATRDDEIEKLKARIAELEKPPAPAK